MTSVAYQLVGEVTTHAQSDSLEDAREICADGTYFPNNLRTCVKCDSSVGIATDYGIESRWGRDFPPVQTGPGAHPDSCTMGSVSFPGVNCCRGVLLTTHRLLVPRS